MTSLTRLLSATALLALMSHTALAQLEAPKLLPSGADELALSGHAVAVQGDRVVVGSPFQEFVDGSPPGGAVYVYERVGATWVESQILTSQVATATRFGSALALDGDVLAISDMSSGTLEERVHIYRHDGTEFVFEQALAAGPAQPTAKFGTALHLSGDELFVGSPWYNSDDLAFSGAVFTFEFNGSVWQQEDRLVANDNALFKQFGETLARDGDDLLVSGSVNSVYFLEKTGTTWAHTLKVSLPGGAAFGDALDIGGDTVVISDPSFSSGTPPFEFARGRIYTWSRAGGVWTGGDLLQGDETSSDGFGSSVKLIGDTLIVGAEFEGPQVGAGYVFTHDGAGSWTKQKRFEPSVTQESRFGASVAVDNDTAVFGAPWDSDLDERAGAAFVVHLNWSDLGASLGGLSDAPRLDAYGALAGGDAFALDVSQAAPNSATFVVLGFTALSATFKGGTLVPAPDFVVPVATNIDGAFSLTATWPVGIPSGVESIYQTWVQDPSGPAGFTATRAVSATTP